MKHLLLSPHSDDAVLFSAFTLQRHAPDIRVLTVYESHVQGEGTDGVRKMEDSNAIMEVLHVPCGWAYGLRDDIEHEDAEVIEQVSSWIRRNVFKPTDKFDVLWVPEIYAEGHAQHNQVGRVGAMLGVPTVRYYHTYIRRVNGKIGAESVPDGVFFPGGQWPVESKPASLDHITNKLRALACYKSQIERDDNFAHFLRDQREWVRP